MSYIDDYRDQLIALVDTDVPQTIHMKYNPTNRWDSLHVSVIPAFDPTSKLKDMFLGRSLRADISLTTDEHNRLINRVLIQCTSETIYCECTSALRNFYMDHSGLTSKKLNADSTYDWLNSLTRHYNMDHNEPYHKEIFGIAKYIHDVKQTDNIIPENHKKNILALLQLLQRKMTNGAQTKT